jgi:hypothetical protein
MERASTHDNYEVYVALNWTDGQVLSNVISNDYTWNSVHNLAFSTKNLARYSHGYLNNLYHKISRDPDRFSDVSQPDGILLNI